MVLLYFQVGVIKFGHLIHLPLFCFWVGFIQFAFLIWYGSLFFRASVIKVWPAIEFGAVILPGGRY